MGGERRPGSLHLAAFARKWEVKGLHLAAFARKWEVKGGRAPFTQLLLQRKNGFCLTQPHLARKWQVKEAALPLPRCFFNKMGGARRPGLLQREVKERPRAPSGGTKSQFSVTVWQREWQELGELLHDNEGPRKNLRKRTDTEHRSPGGTPAKAREAGERTQIQFCPSTRSTMEVEGCPSGFCSQKEGEKKAWPCIQLPWQQNGKWKKASIPSSSRFCNKTKREKLFHAAAFATGGKKAELPSAICFCNEMGGGSGRQVWLP